MHVKMMITTTPNWRALIPGNFAIRTTRIERHPANTATLFRRLPLPHAHCVYVIVFDLHGRLTSSFTRRSSFNTAWQNFLPPDNFFTFD